MASNNPGRTEVTRPFDRKQRDIDVGRKLQWYGVFEGLRVGKLPSNKQIDVAMNSAIDSDLLKNPSKELSQEGRLLVQDLRNVLNQAKLLLLSKNHEESLQQFVYLTSNANPSGSTVSAPVSQDKAQRDGDKALDSLKTLGVLIITNGQFRKLLSDIGLLARDIAADSLEKIQDKTGLSADKLRPDQDALERVNEHAPDNTWHDKPDVNGLKDQAKDKLNDIKSRINQEKSEAEQTSGSGPSDRQQQKLLDAKDDIKDKANAKAEQTKADVKDYLTDKVPEETRDAAVERLKKMVVEIQDHEDYNDAIETLLDLARDYTGYAQDITSQGVDAAHQTAKSDDKLKLATRQLKKSIEYFANSSSTDDIVDALNDVYVDAQKDPLFRKWFQDVDRYIRRVLKETGYILSEDSDKQFNELQKRGQDFAQHRYKEHYSRLIDEFQRWFEQFEKDPQNRQFGQTVQKLIDDLGTDRKGERVFKKHLLKDVTNVVIPGIFKRINYVPLPRIEIIDPKFEAIIENLVLDGANIIPNIIEIENHNNLRYSAYKRIDNVSHHRFNVSLRQIQLDIKDVAYYVKRKQGFPAISDTGVMDVLLSGNGLSATIGLETAEGKDRQAYFKPANVNVSIHHINIKLRKSSHKLLFGVFKPLLLTTLKPVIAKAAEQQIRESISKLDAELYSLNKKVKAEKEKAKQGDPEGAVKDIQLWIEQIKTRFLENKRQKEERVKQTTVNVSATLAGSKLKDKKLDGVTSNTATELKKKAAEGSDWHSEVFSIGSANPSTNVPKPAAISRKSPNERATLNHPQHEANQRAAAEAGISGNNGSLDNAGGNTSASGSYAFSGTNTSAPSATLPAGSSATYEKPQTDGLAPALERVQY
ncbi:hypothetical protein PYCC9005_001079 [Savitreella phatthalungensis]